MSTRRQTADEICQLYDTLPSFDSPSTGQRAVEHADFQQIKTIIQRPATDRHGTHRDHDDPGKLAPVRGSLKDLKLRALLRVKLEHSTVYTRPAPQRMCDGMQRLHAVACRRSAFNDPKKLEVSPFDRRAGNAQVARLARLLLVLIALHSRLPVPMYRARKQRHVVVVSSRWRRWHAKHLRHVTFLVTYICEGIRLVRYKMSTAVSLSSRHVRRPVNLGKVSVGAVASTPPM
jgi:hypothetical protein